MSINIENNLKLTENKDIFEQRTHYMPCLIEENGTANIQHYFEPYIKENLNEKLKATFRGHPLDGVKMKTPEGYRAIIVTETKRPLSEDTQRKFQVNGGFKEFIYWNWDKKPSKNDNLVKAMDWIDLAEAVSVELEQNRALTPVSPLNMKKVDVTFHKYMAIELLIPYASIILQPKYSVNVQYNLDSVIVKVPEILSYLPDDAQNRHY